MSSILLEYQKLQDRQPTKYNDCLENHLENGSKCNLLHFNHLRGILTMLSLNFERLTLHFNGLCGNLHWQRKGGLPVLQNLSGIFLLNYSPPFSRFLGAEQTDRQTAGFEEINWFPLTIWLTRWLWQWAFKSPSPQALWWNWVSKTFWYICISWIPRLTQRYVYLLWPT